MAKSYLTVKTNAESEYVIERSRFIGYSARTKNEQEARDFIDAIKKKNSLATHNCYAYILDENGNTVKFSDDGEPQGTAGIPILEVLKNRNLRYVTVVVTRYFGGIKLGAGGLVRAYTKSATDAIDKAGISEFTLSTNLSFTMPYDVYGAFCKFLTDKKYTDQTVSYDSDVTVNLFVPCSDADGFCKNAVDYLNGKVSFFVLESEYKEYKL